MSNASEYADSLLSEIQQWDQSGHPFGLVSDDNPVTDKENGDEVSAWDYLESALDIQYLVAGTREYRSARILIAFGGPNAWINTNTGQLEVSWWSAPEYRNLPSDFIGALDEALAELWEMGA